MASASSTSAKSLFADSKARLSDRVQNNVNNIASLARQIQRGSKTNETALYFVKLINVNSIRKLLFNHLNIQRIIIVY
ncbi:unnamed protein product [Nesidiocoris tenuis]|uniref:BLOC-1-related complex subunit 7 n=1 Tax=Nesidiocoris tenuis TaxID=355587 RepID=A0A6H5G5A0_9HEMI|nr:unnamed protein product [Nesidiocoris tenuis]